MDDICRVEVEQCAEHLVEDVLNVVIGQCLFGLDKVVEIDLHKVGDEVDFSVLTGRKFNKLGNCQEIKCSTLRLD